MNTAGLGILTELATGLERVGDIDSGLDIVGAVVEQLGFSRVSYGFLPKARTADGRWIPPPVRVWNPPAGWDDAAWARLSANDPYYHACFSGSPVVDWLEVQREVGTLSPLERTSISYLMDLNVGGGITVPIRQRSHFAFMSVLDECSADDLSAKVARSRDMLFLAAHFFHNAMFTKFGGVSLGLCRDLSAREIECLTWSARGKTFDDVATILGISRETVKIHLRRAGEKLGAVNRTHAIAKAVALGMIAPE